MSQEDFKIPVSISVSGRGNPIIQLIVTVNGKRYNRLPHPYTSGEVVDPKQALMAIDTEIQLSSKAGEIKEDDVNIIRVFAKTTKSFDTQILTLDFSNGECFVPIRNLKWNIPGGEGYKTQLQIIFADENKKECRYITVPNPKEGLTARQIKAAVGETVEFGEWKCEVDVSPYGYIRYYAPDENTGRQVIQRLMQLSKGKIVEEPLDSFRASKRKRVFQRVVGKPVRAILFVFEEGKEPLCRRYNLKNPD